MKGDTKMKVFYLNEKPILTNKSIYLGGASYYTFNTEGSWRQKALKILQNDLGFTGTVYVPEICNYELFPFKLTNELYDRWTSSVLEICGCACFYLMKTTSSSVTSLRGILELASSLSHRPDHVLYGASLTAGSINYLNYLYTKSKCNYYPAEEEVADYLLYNLEDLLRAAVKQVESVDEKIIALPNRMQEIPESMWTCKKALSKGECEMNSDWEASWCQNLAEIIE